jgi:hypothetical protein
MKPRSTLLALAAMAALGGVAQAQTATAPALPVTGVVPALCSTGALAGDGVFSLGTLIDTTTGFLRTDLAAAPKTLTGGFCNAKSTIGVAATPLTAQSFVGAAPAGFSSTVHYTASAANWTTTPASFRTGQSSNPAASQGRADAYTGDVVVSLGAFATAGGEQLRLVSDPVYRGVVTVTLAAAN